MYINRDFLTKYGLFKQLIAKRLALLLVGMGLVLGLSWPIFTINAISFAPSKDAVDVSSTKLFLSNNIKPNIFATKRVKVVLTAYSSEVEQTDEDPFTTASGTQVEDGIVASNDLPFGTRVQFPTLYGDKVFVVADRMNQRFNGRNRIDIWMEETHEAVHFGVQEAYAVVLD